VSTRWKSPGNYFWVSFFCPSNLSETVSSGTDEQVGSSSQSTMTQTNKNMYHTNATKEKDEMQVVDEDENVHHEHVVERTTRRRNRTPSRSIHK
jgi:hypothetical protein